MVLHWGLTWGPTCLNVVISVGRLWSVGKVKKNIQTDKLVINKVVTHYWRSRGFEMKIHIYLLSLSIEWSILASWLSGYPTLKLSKVPSLKVKWGISASNFSRYSKLQIKNLKGNISSWPLNGVFVCLCWDIMAKSTHYGHVEHGQFI